MEYKIGLFYGSDTGVTEDIADKIISKWKICPIEKHCVDMCKIEDFEPYNFIFLGLSTWYYGELQSDWENFVDDFVNIDFTGKTVALFGPGDQYGYDDYFVDGIGIIAEIVLENGGTIIGHFPTKGFDFIKSKALVNDDFFYGLAIDEDNQHNLTDQRIDQWIRILEEDWPK